MTNIIIFDLDGTLLSSDSTKVWLIKQLKSNFFRFIVAILIIPIAIPLMKIKTYKYLGASLFLWIATYGLNENQLEENFKDFAAKLKNNSIDNLYWFNDGILEIKNNLQVGRQVIVVTAAPELLATALIRSLNLNIPVLGTPLEKKMGSWVSGIHCRHDEKVRRLKLFGIDPKWFATYTDDIEEDYPILLNSKYRYLINYDKSKITNNSLDNVKYLEWF